MKKRLTKMGKTIIAEIYYERTIDGFVYELLVDSKSFNMIMGELFFKEPTQKTYDDANKWADSVIKLHEKITK